MINGKNMTSAEYLARLQLEEEAEKRAEKAAAKKAAAKKRVELSKGLAMAFEAYEQTITDAVTRGKTSYDNTPDPKTYSAEYIQQYKKNVATDVGRAINAADKKLKESIEKMMPGMRTIIEQTFLDDPDADFVDRLKVFHDFDIKLTSQEVDRFIDAASGNWTNLRILQSVASASGYSLELMSAEEIEDCLQLVENVRPAFTAGGANWVDYSQTSSFNYDTRAAYCRAYEEASNAAKRVACFAGGSYKPSVQAATPEEFGREEGRRKRMDDKAAKDIIAYYADSID